MDKKTITPILFGTGFLSAAIAFWYFLADAYRNPFAWLRFDQSWHDQLIPIAFCIIVMIMFASLLTIFRGNPLTSYLIYGIGAMTAFLFLPVGLGTLGAIVAFVAGFIGYETATAKVFHSYIKISFWGTYSSTIPGLLTVIAFVFALGHYQAAVPAAEAYTFKISDQMFSQISQVISQPPPEDPTDAFGLQQLLSNVEIDAQDMVLNQARTTVEDEVNNVVDQYRVYIPIVSAVAVFLFFSIINLPVMILTTGLVVATMKVMTAAGVMAIVPVKMDVERIAW